MTPNNELEGWEDILPDWVHIMLERYTASFGDFQRKEAIEDFYSLINSLLSKQRKELVEEIEKMKHPEEIRAGSKIIKTPLLSREENYNQALSDVLTLLKK